MIDTFIKIIFMSKSHQVLNHCFLCLFVVRLATGLVLQLIRSYHSYGFIWLVFCMDIWLVFCMDRSIVLVLWVHCSTLVQLNLCQANKKKISSFSWELERISGLHPQFYAIAHPAPPQPKSTFRLQSPRLIAPVLCHGASLFSLNVLSAYG